MQLNNINKIVLAFPDNKSSVPLIQLSKKIRVEYVLGSEENLLSRYKKAAIKMNADYIIRVTSDCPLVDPLLLDNMINLILENKYDIITNVIPPDTVRQLYMTVCIRTVSLDACMSATTYLSASHFHS